MDQPFQILLFEDNDADVFLVQKAIEDTGLPAEVTVCSDGEDAIALVERIESGESPHPDLLLLDLNLPKFSGEEILERIRQGPNGRSCATVVLTSSDSPHDRARAKALGVDVYFRKPPDLEEFMKLGAIVGGFFRKRAGGQAAS